MANLLALGPLAPLGSGAPSGLTPGNYAEIRRRQSLADALASDASSTGGAGGSAFGAIGQALKGFGAGSLRAQNGTDIASFGQSSPEAVAALGAYQPPGPAEGLGNFFGRISALLSTDPVQRAQQAAGVPPPDPNGWSYPNDRY